MKKIILLLALVISVIGLNAQTIGSYVVANHAHYDLQYTVTKLSPAECSVKCINLTSESAIDVISVAEKMTIEGVVFTVTSVAASGFEYIYSARKIELPNTITTFGDRAFYYCKLATEITIPESVVSLGDKTFYGCPLTEVIIPNGVTKIGNSLFELCTELTHIEIPNTVESIGIMAFKSCKSLTEIELPESIKTINDYAFSDCSNLSLIKCLATTPPAGSRFIPKSLENIIIRVPAESVELYQSTEPWSNYDIRAIGTENIEEESITLGMYPNPAKDNITIEANDDINTISIYDVYGRLQMTTTSHQSETTIDISNLNNGIYFVKVTTRNNETTKRFIKK